MKQGKFKVEIYGFNVRVVVLKNKFKCTDYCAKLMKKLKVPAEDEGGLCSGFVIAGGFDAYIAFSEKDLSISTITHECSHLIFKILNFNNIEDGRDNEHLALLTGYINEKVFKIIKKLCPNKIKI